MNIIENPKGIIMNNQQEGQSKGKADQPTTSTIQLEVNVHGSNAMQLVEAAVAAARQFAGDGEAKITGMSPWPATVEHKVTNVDGVTTILRFEQQWLITFEVNRIEGTLP